MGLSPAVSFDGTRTPEGGYCGRAVAGLGAGVNPQVNPAWQRDPACSCPGCADRRMPPRPVMPSTPLEAFRSGTQALRQGRTEQGMFGARIRRRAGRPGAIWKLGRMYADGDGVT